MAKKPVSVAAKAAKKPAPVVKVPAVEPVRAPINIPAVHKALGEYRNDALQVEAIAGPLIERAAVSLKALGVASGLGDELQSCKSVDEVIARVKAAL